MSIRHPELCNLIERLYAEVKSDQVDPSALTAKDVDLLREYIAPPSGSPVGDRLDSLTIGLVHELTGSEKVTTPRGAAAALLALQR
jgi:hypothetical protein